jgi:Uma2 family endonuclease
MSAIAERYRFTVEEYHRMIDGGIFRKEDRVELLDGEIFVMTPIGRLHTSVVDRLTRVLVSRLGDRAIVRVQGPVPAGPRSEPEPDIAVLRDVSDFYATTPLEPDRVLLVIEIADTSLVYDRAKLRIYAAAGISETWIVNLPDGVVEVHRTPDGGIYRETQVRHRREQFAPSAFPDLVLTVDGILG